MISFWAKGIKSAGSARTLLDNGDSDGAVNRAYYAMYYAARSTLEHIAPQAAAAKKHSTIIGQFARHVVRGRGLEPEFGRLINLVFDQRLIADYEIDGVLADDAIVIVADMARFLEALAALNGQENPP